MKLIEQGLCWYDCNSNQLYQDKVIQEFIHILEIFYDDDTVTKVCSETIHNFWEIDLNTAEIENDHNVLTVKDYENEIKLVIECQKEHYNVLSFEKI